MAGGVFTFGDADNNFDAGYLHAQAFDEGETDGIILLGGKAKINKGFYFIAEYTNFQSRLLNRDEKFKGLFTAGFRFFAGVSSIDLGLGFILEESEEVDIPAFPILKASVYF